MEGVEGTQHIGPSRPWPLPRARHLGVIAHVTLPGTTAPLEGARVTWAPVARVIAAEYAATTIYDTLPGTGAGAPASADLLAALADFSNPLVQARYGHLDLVPPRDWVTGPGRGLVMAAFTFPGRPSRFTDGSRGVFYAGLEPATAVAEVAYHLTRQLRANASGDHVTEHVLLHAALDAELVDVRLPAPAPPDLLHPANYAPGQAFGALLRAEEADGVLYPSVRAAGGRCVAVFRPPVLTSCVPHQRLRYQWSAAADRIVRIEG